MSIFKILAHQTWDADQSTLLMQLYHCITH